MYLYLLKEGYLRMIPQEYMDWEGGPLGKFQRRVHELSYKVGYTISVRLSKDRTTKPKGGPLNVVDISCCPIFP